MSSVELTAATVRDVKFVHSLICELEGAELDFPEFEDTYLANLADDSIRYFVIRADGRACGFISLHTHRLLHHNGPVSEIQEFILSGEARGGGTGGEVMARIVQLTKSLNIKQLEVCTNKARERTRVFYRKCGFTESHFKYTLPTCM